jgi:hypothetical protein
MRVKGKLKIKKKEAIMAAALRWELSFHGSCPSMAMEGKIKVYFVSTRKTASMAVQGKIKVYFGNWFNHNFPMMVKPH